jgi:hypothetical protein
MLWPKFILIGVIMNTVNVLLAFSTGDTVSVNFSHGDRVSDIAVRVGAPGSATYRVNGSPATRDTLVGAGDMIMISASKVDAG